MENKIIKYAVRKPLQAAVGGISGLFICLVPGFIILRINDALAPEGNGTTGPLNADITTTIMGVCIFGGIIGGAGLGLYM